MKHIDLISIDEQLKQEKQEIVNNKINKKTLKKAK